MHTESYAACTVEERMDGKIKIACNCPLWSPIPCGTAQHAQSRVQNINPWESRSVPAAMLKRPNVQSCIIKSLINFAKCRDSENRPVTSHTSVADVRVKHHQRPLDAALPNLSRPKYNDARDRHSTTIEHTPILMRCTTMLQSRTPLACLQLYRHLLPEHARSRSPHPSYRHNVSSIQGVLYL